MRTLRPDPPFLYDEATRFAFGGHHILTAGHDLLMAASGYMVHGAEKALAPLKDQGIDATLLDLYSVPFDADAIMALAQENRARFSVCAVWSSPPDPDPAHPHLPHPVWTITLTSPRLHHYRCQRREITTFQPLTALHTALIAPALLVMGPRGPRSSNRSVLRLLIMKHVSVRCRLCGRSAADDPGVRLEVDHIMPASAWGTTVEHNLWVICKEYNRGKHDRSIEAEES
jgi:hypothetical protein